MRKAFGPWWMSFRLRSVITLVVTGLLVWGGWATMNFIEAGNDASKTYDPELKITAEEIIRLLPRTAANQGPAGNFRLSEQTPRRNGDELNFQIWSRDRQLITRTGSTPSEPLNPAFIDGYSTQTVQGIKWRSYTLSDADGEIQVQVGTNLEQRKFAAAMEAQATFVHLALLLIPVAGGLLLMGWLNGLPLQRLQRAIERRELDDMQHIPSTGLPLEALPLVNAFNALLDRAALARQAQRRFVADAAHELRTPMAALRVQAQVALRTNDPAQRDEALRDLIEGIDRNTRVAEQLLEMARVDGRELQAATPTTLIDLSEIVQHAVEQTRTIAARREVRIHCTVPKVQVLSEQALLNALIRNLLDNAVRYTQPSTSVNVQGMVTTESIELWIDDQGPGLSESEIAQALQPFVRLESSNESGTGLGLPIVARACELLGHQLRFETVSRGKGLRAIVSFASNQAAT
jgi:signal transduction histidine kinase